MGGKLNMLGSLQVWKNDFGEIVKVWSSKKSKDGMLKVCHVRSFEIVGVQKCWNYEMLYGCESTLVFKASNVPNLRIS